MEEKICGRCRQLKSLDEFHLDSNRKTGRAVYCKQCATEAYLKRKAKGFTKEYIERKRLSKREYRQSHKEEQSRYQRMWGAKLKLEVLSLYSKGEPVCCWCGERRIDCLSIDHINNGGEIHRAKLRTYSGTLFYKWLKQNSFPLGFQVLCMNCQFIKKMECHRAKPYTPRK